MIDTPITRKFFRKLELYLELTRQNKRSKKSPRGQVMWDMEKTILLWALRGHWHLGTPLTPKYIEDRLIENGFDQEDAKKARQVSQNLVFKMFATRVGHPYEVDVIQLSNEGFLMGEVIEEANSWRECLYIIFIIFIWMTVGLAFIKVISEILHTLNFTK